MNYIYLLFFFEILLFLIAFLLSGQDIMAPSVVMCVMFLISTGFAMTMVDQWEMNYGLDSCFILVSGLFCFIVAEAGCRYIIYKRRCLSNKTMIDYRNISTLEILKVPAWMIIALIIFDIVVCAWYTYQISEITGQSGLTMYNQYREMTAHLADRANSGIKPTNAICNQFLKVVTASGYISAYVIIFNRIFGRQRFYHQIGLFIVSLLSLAPTIMGAGRVGILRFISAVLIEFYIVWHQKHGWEKNLSWRYIKIGLCCVLFGIPIFYYSLPLLGRSTTLNLLVYVAKYTGSSIQLFDVFVKDPIKPEAFGEESLLGIHQFLARIGLPAHLRDENLEFRVSGSLRSNIYTFFRRPLHDFGFWGMLVFTALVAILFAFLYYGKIKWKPSNRRTDFWILIYGYLFFWIVSASTVQRSGSYISLGAALYLGAIIIGYMIMTRAKRHKI